MAWFASSDKDQSKPPSTKIRFTFALVIKTEIFTGFCKQPQPSKSQQHYSISTMFRTVLLRSANLTKRSFATAARDPLVPKTYNTTFKQNFMSDPSTYPLIAIMTIAVSLIVGMSANALGRYKNVKIMPSHKHEVIPNWDEAQQHYASVTEVISRRPIAFHADGFKALRHEGLGVDHDEWVKKNQGHK